jgi:acylphosphatase
MVRVIIEGRVQGVGFRFWTERLAAEHHISGWVRNRGDGAVEALFCGRTDDVAAMLARCQRGPSAARVAAVKVSDVSGETPLGFTVRESA